MVGPRRSERGLSLRVFIPTVVGNCFGASCTFEPSLSLHHLRPSTRLYILHAVTTHSVPVYSSSSSPYLVLLLSVHHPLSPPHVLRSVYEDYKEGRPPGF